jgi:oligopeptide/dipeptide ABC transporter ATP-binding protein
MTVSPSQPILEVAGLHTHFQTPGGTLRAVNGVSFAVNRGESLGLVGESGSGKSTLALTVLRLAPSTSGRIRFEGAELTQLRHSDLKPLRRNLQVVFQDPYSSLPPRLSVAAILEEPLKIFGIGSRSERRAAVDEMLAAVGLERLRGHKAFPQQLSGGERQRVAIARALILRPSLVICDEPVSSLDVSIQAQILSLLRSLQERFDLSYFFISHDLRVVHSMCERVAVMYLGKIVESGPVGQLFKAPLHPYTKLLIAAVPPLEVETKWEPRITSYDVPSPLDVPPGCPFHPRCPWRTEVCTLEPPELVERAPGHFVSCHHVAEIEAAQRRERD